VGAAAGTAHVKRAGGGTPEPRRRGRAGPAIAPIRRGAGRAFDVCRAGYHSGMTTTALHDMFALGVPVLEKMLRPVVVYASLIVGLRLAGKRELAQLNTFDLIVLLMLSNTVQNAIIGDDNTVTGGIIGAATLLVVNHWVVRFLFSHEGIDKLVEGDADVLIEGGQVQHDRLKKELITESELLSAAHKQGFASLEEIDRAILEPGGTIAFFAHRPTPDIERHLTVMAKLDEISARLAAIRA
jgi:uncharacterized membrane protein YcaP (DUF421 family)